MSHNGEKISCDGLSLTIREWAQKTGLTEASLRRRLNEGLEPKDVFESNCQPNGAMYQRFYHDGESLTIKEWSAKSGVPASTIRTRLRNGMSVGKALHVGNLLSVRPNVPNVPAPEPMVSPRTKKGRGREPRMISSNGHSLTAKGWAKKLGMCYATVCRRLKLYPIEKALSPGAISPGRVPRTISCHGETLSVPDWSRKIGVNYNLINSRLKRGWPPEKALSDRSNRGRPRKVILIPYDLTFEGRTMGLPEWASEIGTSVETLVKRIKHGYPIEKVLKPDARGKNGRTVLLTKDGKTQNLTEWAKELGITISAMSRRMDRTPNDWAFQKSHRTKYDDLPENRKWKLVNRRAIDAGGKGWTFEEFMEDVGIMPGPKAILARKDPDKPWGPGNAGWINQSIPVKTSPAAKIIRFRGKEMSLRAWGKELGLGIATISQRLNRLGWTIEKALTTPHVPSGLHCSRLVTWNGQTMSMRAWAKKLGLSYTVIGMRFRKGMSADEVFTTPIPVRAARILTHQGRTMRARDWEREKGLTKGTIQRRLRGGWSQGAAIDTPLKA